MGANSGIASKYARGEETGRSSIEITKNSEYAVCRLFYSRLWPQFENNFLFLNKKKQTQFCLHVDGTKWKLVIHDVGGWKNSSVDVTFRQLIGSTEAIKQTFHEIKKIFVIHLPLSDNPRVTRADLATVQHQLISAN